MCPAIVVHETYHAITSGEEEIPLDATDSPVSFEAYSNPFRTTANFRIELDQPAVFSIDLFDLHGRRVAAIAQSWHSAGPYVITWRAADLPAGMYLTRLQAGTAVANAAVALIRYEMRRFGFRRGPTSRMSIWARAVRP